VNVIKLQANYSFLLIPLIIIAECPYSTVSPYFTKYLHQNKLLIYIIKAYATTFGHFQQSLCFIVGVCEKVSASATLTQVCQQ